MTANRQRKPNTPCPHGQRVKARCKECSRAAQRAWRDANPGRHRERYLARRHANAEKENARARKYYAANPAKGRAATTRRRRSLFPATYGISYAEAVAMREAQGNLCAICGREMSDIKWSETRWAVDHYDTPSGPVVRGILHASCNAALGMMNDHDPQALRNAADYIERHGRADGRKPRVVEKEEPEAHQLTLRLIKGDG